MIQILKKIINPNALPVKSAKIVKNLGGGTYLVRIAGELLRVRGEGHYGRGSSVAVRGTEIIGRQSSVIKTYEV